MKRKNLAALLLAALLALSLTACSGGDERGAASGGEEGSSSAVQTDPAGESEPSSSEASDPEMAAPTTMDEAAEYFRQALLTGNLTGIQTITAYNGYEDWADVTFDSIEYQTIAQDFESSRYQFTFTVSQSDCPTFPEGTFQRVVAVGTNYMLSDHPIVTMLYDDTSTYYELFPYDMEQTGYPAYAQVSRFVSFMGNIEFASTSALSDEQLAEYAMLMIFDDYGGERELFSVSEVNAMVETLFGISGFDASQTKFYDAEAGGCKMLGRGGNTYYTMTAPATNEDGPWVLDMTFYSDPLCTVKEKTVRYTLEENGSHLRFISAVAL